MVHRGLIRDPWQAQNGGIADRCGRVHAVGQHADFARQHGIAGALLRSRETNGDVGFAFGEAEVTKVRHDLHMQLRVMIEQFAAGRHQQAIHEDGYRGQPDPAHDGAIGAGDVVMQLQNTLLDQLRLQDGLRACGGRQQPPRLCSVGKLDNERILDRSDAPGARRFIDAEHARGRGYGPGPSHGEDITQVIPVDLAWRELALSHRCILKRAIPRPATAPMRTAKLPDTLPGRTMYRKITVAAFTIYPRSRELAPPSPEGATMPVNRREFLEIASSAVAASGMSISPSAAETSGSA